MTILWILLALFGGSLVISGIYLYQEASEVIRAGEALMGAGWAFQDFTPEEAEGMKLSAIAMMVFGGIMALVGVLKAVR